MARSLSQGSEAADAEKWGRVCMARRARRRRPAPYVRPGAAKVPSTSDRRPSRASLAAGGLGGLRVLGAAGEAVAELLAHLRGWLDDDRLIAWAYSQNGRGYLPTDQLIPEGGYEVVDNHRYQLYTGPFTEGTEEAIRSAVRQSVEGDLHRPA